MGKRKKATDKKKSDSDSGNDLANGLGNGQSLGHLGKRKRIYRPKDSLMTELCSRDKNIEALYHVIMVMIAVSLLYSMLLDTVEAGKPHIDFTYYVVGFGPLDMQVFALLMWIQLQTAALLVYPMFRVWKWLRRKARIPADLIFILLKIVYNISAHTAVVWVIHHYQLFPVPALVLLVEQLRFTMKSYSFVRENVYKVVLPWKKDDPEGPAVWYQGQISPTVGSFRQYCYFLFCPTLVYRDHYPRSARIRWTRVFSYFLKCCATVAFVTILSKETFSIEPTSSKNILRIFLTCCLWGLVLQFMTGYFFLHSWCNLFAELLRFADREFYSDWWTCSDYATFYRKWNLLIHDWIKAYIYQDLKDLFRSPTYNKIAFMPAIAISGLVHEYVLWAPMRFVVPILLVQFGAFGSILFFFRPSPNVKFWNYFLHMSLHFGVSFMLFFYTMEYTARKVCPKEENFVNTFVPRFYECFVSHPLNKQ